MKVYFVGGKNDVLKELGVNTPDVFDIQEIVKNCECYHRPLNKVEGN